MDGPDEFGSDHAESLNVMNSLINDNAHIKLCVASRPWKVFYDAFGHGANLRLRDLTFQDFKNFVQTKFNADPKLEKLHERYGDFADELVNNIVLKASGVFLWVALIVSSLLAGMRYKVE